jgi:hypothetical protein
MPKYSRDRYRTRPVFEGLMPPHSEDELKRLDKSIQLEGVHNPILIWRETGVIIEGHTRYRIAKKYRQKFPVKFLNFDTEEEAVMYAIDHGLGRRNLDSANAKMLVATLYEMMKKPVGTNQHTRGDQVEPPSKTSEKVAKLTNMSEASVKRAVEFKKQVDAATTPEEKEKILSGEKKREIRTREKKQGEIIFDMEDVQSLCGKVERMLDKMCRAYGLVDPKQGAVKETPEVNGLRRSFRAWKKELEAEQKRLAKNYTERNGA